jgi:hypothetical protein
MGITSDTLNALLEYGIRKKYFIQSAIGDIDKTCCKNSKIVVIDFDDTKTKIVAEHNYFTMKSCDALRIVPDGDSIEFIEFKSSINIINNPRNQTPNNLAEQVRKFDLKGKIKDSLHVLEVIVSKRDNGLSKENRDAYHSTKKKYIILTDISLTNNPVDVFNLTLNFLASSSSTLAILLKEEIEKIGIDLSNSIKQPILMSCKAFK